MADFLKGQSTCMCSKENTKIQGIFETYMLSQDDHFKYLVLLKCASKKMDITSIKNTAL